MSHGYQTRTTHRILTSKQKLGLHPPSLLPKQRGRLVLVLPKAGIKGPNCPLYVADTDDGGAAGGAFCREGIYAKTRTHHCETGLSVACNRRLPFDMGRKSQWSERLSAPFLTSRMSKNRSFISVYYYALFQSSYVLSFSAFSATSSAMFYARNL